MSKFFIKSCMLQVTDDGSESSCCEEACMPGDSSDAGSKGNSDSGIHTDPTPSPPLADDETDCVCQQQSEYVSQPSEEPVEELSTAEDDVTSNLCATAVEFSSQECTLSRSSSPSFTKECVTNDNTPTHDVLPQQETFVVCQDDVLVGDICILPQETDIEDQVRDSCSFTQDTVLTQSCEEEEDICSLLTKQETISDGSKIEDECCNSCLSTEDILEVCHDEVQIGNGFLLAEEITVVCPDKDPEETSLLHKSNNHSSPISVNLEIPDPLLLNYSSDDLKTAHEECEEVTESIIEITKEVLIDNSVEELSDEDNSVISNSQDESQTAQCRTMDVTETVLIVNVKNEEYDVCLPEKEETEVVTEPEFVATITKGTEASTSLDTDSRFPVSDDDMVPVPPPRRKRSMCRAADKLATKVVEEAIREGVQEAARSRLSSPLSITEAVTRWLNSHESSPLTCRFPDSESEDEEGIEAVEETEMTGPKNVQGNPLPVPSHNGVGQRVAKDCESVMSEWDFGRARDMCDPARSVDKYYRLGADGEEGDRIPPSVYKTAVHIRHNGPFPCGVCCIIQ